LTTCPCCGARFDGDLTVSPCGSCGARAVGPPLARPERELPSYGHAFVITAAGALLAIAFAAAVAGALLRRETFSLGWRALVSAGEAAAWGMKWTALPLSLAAAAVCGRLYRRMLRDRTRFVGFGAARAGLAATALTAALLVTLIGVSVPERLRRRELALRAAENARLYAGDAALRRYRQRFGTYPASLADLRRLDDPDCSLAEALAAVEAAEYRPETDLASLSAGRPKSRLRRRAGEARVRNASARADADDVPGAGLVLTNYRLTLPGRDGRLGTADDLLMRDGLIVAAP